MSDPRRPFRLLLLVLLLAAVALLAWSVQLEDETEPAGAPPNEHATRDTAPARAAAGPPGAVPTVDVESLASQLGVLLPGAEEDAVLQDVSVDDSAFFGNSMPFVSARSFALGDTPFALTDGAGPVGEQVVPRVANLDSLLRADAVEGCSDVGVRVRMTGATGAAAGDGRWQFGVARGTLEPWPAHALPSHPAGADTLHPDTTALRLGLAASGDTAGIFRDVPPRVDAERVEYDGAEILIARAWRTMQLPDAGTVEQQIFLIAERPAGAPDRAWKVAYSSESIDDPDQVTTLRRMGAVLMGRPRRPVVLLDADYRDGGGGIFVGRLSPGAWRGVASWYSGC